MGIGIKQAVLRELSLDLHQLLTERTEQSYRYRLVIDEGAAAAICRQQATQHQRLLLAGKPLLLQAFPKRMIWGQLESGGDTCLISSVTDQRRLCSGPQRQTQGV